MKGFLARLHTGTIVFEPHLPDEEPMRGAYLNPEPEAFAELVRQWAGLTSVEPLGTAADGRRLFVLRR